MIYEESFNFEDWSMILKKQLYFIIYSNRKQIIEIVIIFHNITFLCIFNQINCLVSIQEH